MKIKLQLKRTPDSAPEYYYTNLFVVTEWERLERRNIQQLCLVLYPIQTSCQLSLCA